MKKLFFLLLMMLSVGLFWGSAVTVQSPEAGRLPVMTAAAVPVGEQDGIAYGRDLVVSSMGKSGLYSGYNANPIGHYFLPTYRVANDLPATKVETLFDEAVRHDYAKTGPAIGCQSTHWRSGFHPRPDAIMNVIRHDGRPGHNAERRILV